MIDDAPECSISAATFVEASIVIEVRYGAEGLRDLDLFLARAAIQIVAVDAEDAALARRAFSHFSRGRHPAALGARISSWPASATATLE